MKDLSARLFWFLSVPPGFAVVPDLSCLLADEVLLELSSVKPLSFVYFANSFVERQADSEENFSFFSP